MVAGKPNHKTLATHLWLWEALKKSWFTNIYDIFRFFSNNPWKMPCLWWLAAFFFTHLGVRLIQLRSPRLSLIPRDHHWLLIHPGASGVEKKKTEIPQESGAFGRWFFLAFGYGSIPIDTFFKGMNIHKSQLFWCELQGYKVLTHCHFIVSWCELMVSDGICG